MSTPSLESEKRPPAERKLKQTVGGRQVLLDSDAPTSLGRPPVYALCEPYTFGMRLAEPATDGSMHKYHYPVAQAYTDAMQALLTYGIEWPAIHGVKEPFTPLGRGALKAKAKPTGVKMAWPMDDDQADAFAEALGPIVETALQATAFGLPKGYPKQGGAMPVIDFMDKETTTAAAGVQQCNPWTFLMNPSLIQEICESQEPSSRDMKLCLLAATIYHEVRHSQQFFWMLAMVKQFPGDYPGLTLMPEVFPEIYEKELRSLAAATPVPEEPTARIAIKRLVISYYYALLHLQLSTLKNRRDAPSQQIAEYEHELAVCEQQVADLLLHVGRNGRPIDYKKLPDRGVGYRLRPWEDDAFACDFVVGQQWFGRALPEPDRCNQFYDLRDGERPDARL
ncbi:hypothetical protein [Cupriavidus basilensis]